MKKLIPLALLVAAAIVVPAQASKPADPGAQGKNKSHSNSRCKHSTLTKSYVFGGTLTANPTLTQTAGANTADASDDLFTVGLTLNVTHANKYAKHDHPNGSTFTDSLSNVVVSFGQNADTTQRTPQTGDHVNIKARQAFKVKHNCQANANAAVGSTNYKRVSFGGQPTPTP